MFAEFGRWAGETVFCLASGPSMRPEDASAVRGQGRVITVNSTFRLAPWADVHYSSDHDWWHLHLPEMRAACKGEFWSGYPFGHIADDVRICPYDKKARGILRTPGRIAWGGNSGYCALGLAYQFGASRIVLLGYDMKDPAGKGHWHGHHDASIKKDFNFDMWKMRFYDAARDFKGLGIEVINCTPVTDLTCFPRKKLEEILC